MLLPIVFFQVCVTLLLVGVLARKGLILADPALTASVIWFTLAPATLWVFAQAAWASRAFDTVYIACLGIALGLATVIVSKQPQGWHSVVVAGLGAAIAIAIILKVPTSRAGIAVAISCPVQLVYALYALTQSTKTEHPFTKIELMWMGLFWLGQAIVSGAYVYGVVKGSQPQVLATNLGAGVAAAAFLGFALTLWTGGVEVVSPLSADKEKKDERGGWMEVAGDWARAKVKR